MRHVAAYLLAVIGEPNTEPRKEKIKSILGSVGVEADEKQLEIVIEKFGGRAPNKLIAEGHGLLSVPAGSVAMAGGRGPAARAAAPAGAPAQVAPKEEKKEEKKEPEEESDEDMGFGLFD